MSLADRYCPLCSRVLEARICPKHNVPTVDTTFAITPVGAPLPGMIVGGHYQLAHPLGEGGMGMVFLATHVGMKRHVAVKILRRELMADGRVLKRFYQEVMAVSSLYHPNIARVIDFGVDDTMGLPFLVMDYLQGQTLRQVLQSEGELSEPRACALLAQVAKALVEAHRNGIIHRDLKPENIMITRLPEGGEHANVLDFGIAKMKRGSAEPNTTLTRPGMTLGTPSYMSPEQASGEETDFRSDLYALGCILFELLSGEAPFKDEDVTNILMKQVTAPPPPLPSRLVNNEAPSRELLKLMRALLAKKKADRPRSTGAVVRVLTALAQRESIAVEAVLKQEGEETHAPRRFGSGILPTPEQTPALMRPFVADLPRLSSARPLWVGALGALIVSAGLALSAAKNWSAPIDVPLEPEGLASEATASNAVPEPGPTNTEASKPAAVLESSPSAEAPPLAFERPAPVAVAQQKSDRSKRTIRSAKSKKVARTPAPAAPSSPVRIHTADASKPSVTTVAIRVPAARLQRETIYRVEPQWPQGLEARVGSELKVVVMVCVETSGRVDLAKTSFMTPPAGAEASIKGALRQWRFTPQSTPICGPTTLTLKPTSGA